MKVEIEKKVKIELNSEETKKLCDILTKFISVTDISSDLNYLNVDFAKQLKQELER